MFVTDVVVPALDGCLRMFVFDRRGSVFIGFRLENERADPEALQQGMNRAASNPEKPASVRIV